MIFCLYGAFLENSLCKQNVPSPHMLAVCMPGEGESLSLFLKLAPLCIVLLRRSKILLAACLEGNHYFTFSLHKFSGQATCTISLLTIKSIYNQ